MLRNPDHGNDRDNDRDNDAPAWDFIVILRPGRGDAIVKADASNRHEVPQSERGDSQNIIVTCRACTEWQWWVSMMSVHGKCRCACTECQSWVSMMSFYGRVSMRVPISQDSFHVYFLGWLDTISVVAFSSATNLSRRAQPSSQLQEIITATRTNTPVTYHKYLLYYGLRGELNRKTWASQTKQQWNDNKKAMKMQRNLLHFCCYCNEKATKMKKSKLHNIIFCRLVSFFAD